MRNVEGRYSYSGSSRQVPAVRCGGCTKKKGAAPDGCQQWFYIDELAAAPESFRPWQRNYSFTCKWCHPAGAEVLELTKCEKYDCMIDAFLNLMYAHSRRNCMHAASLAERCVDCDLPCDCPCAISVTSVFARLHHMPCMGQARDPAEGVQSGRDQSLPPGELGFDAVRMVSEPASDPLRAPPVATCGDGRGGSDTEGDARSRGWVCMSVCLCVWCLCVCVSVCLCARGVSACLRQGSKEGG